MEVIGYCKSCKNPVIEDNFIEREWGFNYCSNELEVTDWYTCPHCKAKIYNCISYKLAESKNDWMGLAKYNLIEET